jgi:hypothetical protein
LANKLNNEFAVEILVSMGRSNWGEIPHYLETFAQEVQKAQRIRYRSGIIALFILCVQTLMSVRFLLDIHLLKQL